MGYQMSKEEAGWFFKGLDQRYDIFAPVLKVGEGCFSDTDIIRYDKVTSPEEIVWDKKSDYSFKETLLHINETIFYFTEDQTTVPKGPEKELLILLKACDLNALKRLDQIYLDNTFGDFYYARIREKAKFVLMGCTESCQTGFCVSMDTNKADNYDAYMQMTDEGLIVDVKDEDLKAAMNSAVQAIKPGADCENCTNPDCTLFTNEPVEPAFVTENFEKVTLPKNLSNASYSNPLWTEYGDRCITCGRCNFVCPTCTCFTMQDIFYGDNAKVGERRRIWASCQVDGYDEIAGGISFRKSKADRMRFKVMHKIYDFEKRFGYTMCVGCGRCDAVCPEYISYSNLINRLAKEEQ